MKLALFVLLFSPVIWSKERFEFFNGVRSLGMGNTSTASVNDETALLINPAGLGKLRNFFGTLVDPEIDIGSSAMNMYRAKSFSNPVSVAQVMPAVVLSPNEYYYSRVQVFPSFVAKNFGIGIFAKNELAAISESATSTSLFFRDDLAILLGYNFRFWEGRIKIGFTGKILSRTEVNEDAIDPALATDIATLATNNYAKHGLGIGSDVGMILTAPWQNLPTLAVVAHDLGNTVYDKSYFKRMTTTERPSNSLQDVDAGFAFQIIHKPNIRSLWTIDYKGILTASSEEDKQKLYHFGLELNFGDVFFVRAGYNQRYLTAGFELSSERFQFQVATYGEEVGTLATPKEDRRNVAKFTFRF